MRSMHKHMEYSDMAKITFKGKEISEVKAMELDAFMKLLPSRERRALKRGFGHDQKNLLAKLSADPAKFYKVHRREMVIIPSMLGAKLGIHNGREYVKVEITPEMLGHRLGEFAMTRKSIKHSAPGFGATKSSKFIPLK